ncbi:MAG: hypothetical protein K2X45_00725, partial [Phreatobacter sp.]|nr:hypothetical protein [Phreatobacter sp.]
LVAEWLRRGLQILAPRFDSGRGLHLLLLTSNQLLAGRIAAFTRGQRRPIVIVSRRRERRMRALSTERITKPTGNIQAPRMGRKLNIPPAMKDQPSACRRRRVRGSRNRRPKTSAEAGGRAFSGRVASRSGVVTVSMPAVMAPATRRINGKADQNDTRRRLALGNGEAPVLFAPLSR